MKPEDIVQKQVLAYNSRDIDAFTKCHHPNVKLYSLGNNDPFVVGRTQLTSRYQDIFEKSPNLNTEIVQRMILGDTVIDKEVITGRSGVEKQNFVAIYQILDGLIFRAYFVRDANVL